MRDDDGSRLALDVAKNLASIGQCPPVRELRFSANGTLLWSVDINHIETAHDLLCKDMAEQAASRTVMSFESMVSEIQSALHWTPDESRALALVFVFPESFALDRVHVAWVAPRSRGRPYRVDFRTKEIWRLARAWQALTGTQPGVAPNALFVAALTAAIPFLTRSRIGPRTANDVSRLLRRERMKLQSPHFRWLPPRDSGAGFQPSN